MTKLSTSERKNLPKSDFGLPSKVTSKNRAGRGAYPMPDRSHAINAKARATQAVKSGHLTKAEERKIDAKANKIINASESKSNSKLHDGRKTGPAFKRFVK